MENKYDTSLDSLEKLFNSLEMKTERLTNEQSDLLEVTTQTEIVSIYSEFNNEEIIHGWHVVKKEMEMANVLEPEPQSKQSAMA